MGRPVFIIAIVLAGILVITCTLVVVLRLTMADRRGDPPAPSHPDARTLSRWRWTGILSGVVLAGVTISIGALGRGLLLASMAFGLCVLVGVLAGELRVRPAHDALRAATLERRSVRSYLPAGLGATVGVATAALVALMAVTTAAGSADDLDRAGRVLRYFPDATHTRSIGPWPGAYYTVPVIVALLVAVLATIVVLRQVTLRPRAGDPSGDDALRRRSAEAVTAAWGVTTGIPLVGIAVTAAFCLFGMETPVSWRVAGTGLLLLALAAVVLVFWCLTTLMVPRRRRSGVVAPVPTADVPATL